MLPDSTSDKRKLIQNTELKMPGGKKSRHKGRGPRRRSSSQSSLEIHVTEHEAIISSSSVITTRPKPLLMPDMWAPKPSFLRVLHSVGAKGLSAQQSDLFTIKQLCYFLKEYIKAKQLYDPLNPALVNCSGDQLADIFGVQTFTINDALTLIKKHSVIIKSDCDSTVKTQTSTKASSQDDSAKLVQDRSKSLLQTDERTPEKQKFSPPRCSCIVQNCIHKSASNVSRLQNPDKSADESDDDVSPVTSFDREFLLKIKGSPRSGKSPLATEKPSPESGKSLNFNIKNRTKHIRNTMVDSTVSPVETITSELSSKLNAAESKNDCSNRSAESLSVESKSAYGKAINTDAERDVTDRVYIDIVDKETNKDADKQVKQERVRRLSGKDSGSSESAGQRRRTKSEHQAGSISERRRQSSFSIVYDDNAPWCLTLEVDSDSEREEVLSIQSKSTVLIQDSTDDLWFCDDDDRISVGMSADGFEVEFQRASPPEPPQFAEEYEVASDEASSDEQNSDDDYLSNVEEIILVGDDSDIEFWADSESSDAESSSTDEEITEQDKWQCESCEIMNKPLHRFCSRCWKVRPGWLPEKPHRRPSAGSTGFFPNQRRRQRAPRSQLPQPPRPSLITTPTSTLSSLARAETLPFDVQPSVLDVTNGETNTDIKDVLADAVNVPTNTETNLKRSDTSDTIPISELPIMDLLMMEDLNHTLSQSSGYGSTSVSLPQKRGILDEDLDSVDDTRKTKEIRLSKDDSGIDSLTIITEDKSSLKPGQFGSRAEAATNESELAMTENKLKYPNIYVKGFSPKEKSLCIEGSATVHTSDVNVDSTNEVASANTSDMELSLLKEIPTAHVSNVNFGSSTVLATAYVSRVALGATTTTAHVSDLHLKSKEIANSHPSDLDLNSPKEDIAFPEGHHLSHKTDVNLSPNKATHSSANIHSTNANLCSICLSRPKEASLIHGKTGHQVCCYPCAMKLKRKRKPCPVCRRPIQKVVKNYIV